MDKVIKAIYKNEAVIYACDITKMANEMQKIHGTYPVATMALGRTLAGATLMCSMLKHKNDKLTISINGGGVTGTLLAAGDASLRMRACIGNPKATVKPKSDGDINVGGAVGTNGFLSVIKDMGLQSPYTGKAPLQTGEIGEDLAYYFYTSEQQPGIVYLNTWVETDFSVIDAGGVIVKPLPHASEEVLSAIEEKVPLLKNFAIYLLSEPLEDVIKRIFGDGVKITETQTPVLYCGCSLDRLRETLKSLGKEELSDMAEKDGGAEITCRFCNKKYYFDKKDLEKLIKEIG